jgi:hypothetical protein
MDIGLEAKYNNLKRKQFSTENCFGLVKVLAEVASSNPDINEK